jgi:hypothetical protein
MLWNFVAIYSTIAQSSLAHIAEQFEQTGHNFLQVKLPLQSAAYCAGKLLLEPSSCRS